MIGKALVCCLLLAGIATNKTLAQVDITIGTGTVGNGSGATGYPCPLQDYYEGSRMQYLYLASELQAAGMTTGTVGALKFTVTGLGSFSGDIDQFTVKLGGTGTNSLSTTDWETVAGAPNFGPVQFVPTAGVNTIALTSPYFWNGIDNIVVEICGGDPNNSSGIFYSNNPTVTWTTGLAFNGSHSFRVDNLGNLCGTSTGTNSGTQTTRPNIIFQFTAAAACAGKPTAGTAATSNATICPGASFALSLTGGTVASGLTYQWQTSTDNVNWANKPGATTSSYATTQLVSTYYRGIVSCGGLSDTSNSVMVSSPALVHGTFTINSGLPTAGFNFQSFGDAVNYFKCGVDGPVVLNVEPFSGPYAEQIVIPAIYGTSSTNSITFNGNGATFSFNTTSSANRAGILLDGADHITIDSLMIDGSTGTYGWGIVLTNSADSNTIKRCKVTMSTTITSTNQIPIVVNGSPSSTNSSGNTGNYNHFLDNTTIGGYYGIVLYGQSPSQCMGNVISGNTITDPYAYSTYVYGQESAVITGNDFTRPTRTSSGTVSACYLNLSLGTLLEKNRVHNMYGGAPTNTGTFYAFYIVSSDGTTALPNKVINNLVYNIQGNGVQYGLYNSGSDSTMYYHNTIVFDDAVSTLGATYGIYQTTLATGIDFRNNIIFITRGGTGVKRGIYLNTTTSSVVSNNNVYYLAAPGGTDNKVGQYGTTSYETLTEWKNANSSTYDQASFFTNPLFQNLVPGEYKPSEAAINNIGASLGVLTDIYGVTRTPLPDPGAVEFTLDACSNPPTAGMATTTDAAPCADATFTLNLEGNSSGAGQTYQWQWSTDDVNWSNVGSSQTTPLFSTSQTTSHYYHALVTCGAGTPVSSASVFVEKPDVAGNYTINNLLPTSGTNFASYAEAISILRCGITAPVTFTVEPFTGPYNEQVTIGEVPGTSAVNTVTFKGNGTTVAFNATASANRTGIILNGSDHVILDSLVVDVTGGASYGWGILLTNRADSNIIRNCSVITSTTSTSTNYSGILINGSVSGTSSAGNNGNGNLFENNTITGGYYGFYAYGSSSTYNKGNSYVNNILLEQYYAGLYLYGQKQTTVSKNDISRPTRTSVTASYGIYLLTSQDSMLVEKNRVHNTFDAIAASGSTYYSIYLSGVDGVASMPNRCENNLVHSITNNSTLYGIFVSGSYWNVYHNTVILDYTAATTTSITYSMYMNATNMNVKNNISFVSRGGTGTKYSLYLGTTFTGDVNYNDWVMNAGAGTANYVTYKGSGYANLADWKLSNAGAYDQNSQSVDPLFQQLTPGDFYPTEPLINNIGENVGVVTDIVDIARSATPDPGAYEFSVAGCVNPPLPGEVVAPSSVCLNSNFVLDLINNSTGEGLSYQWQSSGNNVDWTNIGPASPAPGYSTSQASNTYYRALVTCNAGTPVPTTSVLVSSPGLAPAGTYTINGTLPTGGGNFQTYGDAVNFIACGIAGPIVFNTVANSGPYNEQVIIPAVNGTSATNTVTWNGNGNTLSFDISDGSKRGVLILDGADHMTFDSLSIDASLGTFGFGIILTNSADSNIVRRCNVLSSTTSTSTNYGGIIMSGGTGSAATQGHSGNGNLFEKNIVTGGYYGIYMYGSTTDTIKYNKAIDNIIKDFYNVGLYTIYSQFITFSGNDVSRPTRTNSGTEAIWVATSYGGMVIEKNKIHNIQESVSGTTNYGFDIVGNGTAAYPNRFENNIVYSIKNGSSTCYGMYAPNISYWTIAHNTIVLDDVSATAGTTYGMYTYGNTGVNIYNNIISVSRGGTGDKYCLYFSSTGVTASNNNVLYMNSTTGTRGIGYYSTTFTTLANWKTANSSKWDQNSVSVDPLFIDAAYGNLVPQESSIFTLGNALAGVPTDILNTQRRVSDPTPGAFEVTAGLPVTILGIDAVRVAADVKVSWETLTETNNKGFQVERSVDGVQFRHVGFVSTKANNGNSSSRLAYQFLDLSAPTSDVYYRLKQQDNNGREQTSNIVRLKAQNGRRFDISNLYPNPVRRGDLTLMMTSQEMSNVTLVVTDVAGKVLKQQAAVLIPGTNTLKINTSNLPAGNYLIRAICPDGCESTVKKFVVQ